MEHQAALKIQRAWRSYINTRRSEYDENECRVCRSTDKHGDKCLDCLNALWRD
jgi:hypothetical protein